MCCSFFVYGFPFCVQFEGGVELFWRWGLLSAFRMRRYFAFDLVSWAPGLPGPHLGGCRCRSLEEACGVGVQGGGLLARGRECCGLGMPTKWCSLVRCCGVGFGSAFAGWIGWP